MAVAFTAHGSAPSFSREPAREPPRLALLIGNKAYTQKVGPLVNPHNDVELVAASLRKVGFTVTVLKDATYKQMDTALKRYVAEVRRAGPGALSFFYYSGHGIANPETQINYLVPVDVADADDDKLWFESFQQPAIMDLLSKQSPAATHYLVFDACRNELNITGPAAKSLGGSKGFVPLADTSGLLIAYATAPKQTASDAGTGGGPYAKVLAEQIVKPGVEAVTMFRTVQIRVKQAIGQDPWLSFPSLPEVYFAGREEAKPVAPPPPTPSSAAETVRICREVESVGSLSMLAVLEKQHAGKPAADCISARIGELKAAQSAARAKPVVPPPPVPAPAAAPAPVPSRPAPTTSGPNPGETFRDCPTCPEMVVVPSGSFTMGSPSNEEGRSANESPQRKVTIARPFAVGKFEVTFAEWDACVAGGGCTHKPADEGWGKGRRPVINVSWNDAKAYVAWLSKTTGQPYRLMTEAEWEYAARAGTTTPFHTGATISTDQANYDGTLTYNGSSKGASRQKPVEVGSFPANAFGLHDMHGNVWEWVEDCWIVSYKGAPSDGSKAQDTKDCSRVLRGGSWVYIPGNLRSAGRLRGSSDGRLINFGFRVARPVVSPRPL